VRTSAQRDVGEQGMAQVDVLVHGVPVTAPFTLRLDQAASVEILDDGCHLALGNV
jgi:hypothetical protein